MDVQRIKNEIDSCLARDVAVMIVPDIGGEALISHNINKVFRSASVIKVPIMLSVLDACDKKELSVSDIIGVDDILPDSEIFEYGKAEKSLYALLYHMITLSDNTSTNAIIELIGMDRVNSYSANVCGTENTFLRRKMLDWNAVASGRENTTTVSDMNRVFTRLSCGKILSEDSRAIAWELLYNQRCRDSLLRYVACDIRAAHKTGGLDYLNHDCGVFNVGDEKLFAAVFVDGTPENDLYAKRFIGRIGALMYGQEI